MREYQEEAIRRVREYALSKSTEHRAFVDRVCEPLGVDLPLLIKRVLDNPITINFHPDRYANNGKTVLENLTEQGMYHSQFRTGTTNGGRSAHLGGNRFQWEQRMFFDAYPPDSLDRPKYGALNLFRFLDGASVRFGSCFFSLKHDIISKCTFSYGDSSTHPTTLCTADTFVGVIAGLLDDLSKKERVLNQIVSSQQEGLALLLHQRSRAKDLGRNLDHCIEAHIHGDIHMDRDVDCFYVDSSFRDTPFHEQAENFSCMYNIELCWIPKRQVEIDVIEALFRGPMIPVLARGIEERFGKGLGVLDAALIGSASRDISLHPNNWTEFGNEPELFQYIKQLWHTLSYFG